MSKSNIIRKKKNTRLDLLFQAAALYISHSINENILEEIMNAEEVFKKLRMDKAGNLLIVNAPEEYSKILEGINYDKTPSAKKTGQYDFVQVFAASQDELEMLCLEAGKAGKEDCLFWVCYPKGTGKIKSDIKRDTVWNALGLIGLRPVSQIAIDETWSAMRGRGADKVGK